MSSTTFGWLGLPGRHAVCGQASDGAYRIEPVLVEELKKALAIADARPDPLRRQETADGG
jgi:hypothetical protein